MVPAVIKYTGTKVVRAALFENRRISARYQRAIIYQIVKVEYRDGWSALCLFHKHHEIVWRFNHAAVYAVGHGGRAGVIDLIEKNRAAGWVSDGAKIVRILYIDGGIDGASSDVVVETVVEKDAV